MTDEVPGAIDPRLGRYVEQCQILVGELETLIGDLEAHERRSGSVVYAVDFAEIFAFIFPRTASDFLMHFDDETRDQARVAQSYVLDKLFATPEDDKDGLFAQHLLILDPHLRELDRFLGQINISEITSLADWAESAGEQLGAIVHDPKLKELVRAIETPTTHPANEQHSNAEHDGDAEGDGDVLTPSEQEAFAYFEGKAPELVLLLDGTTLSAHRRIEQVIGSRRLATVRDVGLSSLDVDVEVARSWEAQLRQKRGDRYVGPSVRDGIAMALVDAVNRAWEAEERIVVLVTRSPYMHDILKAGATPPTSSDSQPRSIRGGVLRHPRFLRALLRTEGYPPVERLDRLRSFLTDVRLFIDSVQEIAGDLEHAEQPLERDNSNEPAYLEVYRRIREGISMSTGLSTWKATSRLLSGSDIRAAKETREILTRLIALSSGRTRLETHIDARIRTLGDDIDRCLRFIGPLLSNVESGNRYFEAFEATSTSVNFRSDRQDVPYRVEFTSPAFRERFDRLRRERDVEPSEILGLIRDIAGPQPDYELVLFCACVLAAWHRWELALRYCNRALEIHREGEDPSNHEALFLKTICLRRQPDGLRTADEFRSAIELIDEATRRQQLDRGPDAPDDPRFLKEKATLIFLWNEQRRDNRQGQDDGDDLPVENDAVDLSLRALQLVDDDDFVLEAQIYNNLCFHFVNQEGRRARRQARHFLSQLRDAQNNISPRESDWSPNVVDTVVWAEFRLFDKTESISLDEYGRWLSRLYAARDRLARRDSARRKMVEHIEAITHARNRAMPPGCPRP